MVAWHTINSLRYVVLGMIFSICQLYTSWLPECPSDSDGVYWTTLHFVPLTVEWPQTQHCSHVFMVYVINCGCSVGQLVVCCPPTNAARFDSWLRSVPGAVSRKSLSSAVWVTLCPWVGTLTQYGGTLKELTVLLKKSRGISQVLAARYWMH